MTLFNRAVGCPFSIRSSFLLLTQQPRQSAFIPAVFSHTLGLARWGWQCVIFFQFKSNSALLRESTFIIWLAFQLLKNKDVS